MIRSMTGFGRSEVSNKDYKIIVEMKSVNHRYCDISIRMPKRFNYFEVGIRSILKEYIVRGKIDVFINYEDYTENKISVKYNRDIAHGYLIGLSQIAEEFKLPLEISASSLSRFPEVLVLEEQPIDEDALFKGLENCVRQSANRFVETRTAEGERLKKDLIRKLDALVDAIDYIEVSSPKILMDYHKKLGAKVQEMLGDTQIDEGVLATELAIFADKICVDEEIVRLKSHIQHMKSTLNENESIGRKLDFIAQEMNREANTILSKSNDLDVTNHAIEIKSEVEKIREQIQNIE